MLAPSECKAPDVKGIIRGLVPSTGPDLSTVASIIGVTISLSDVSAFLKGSQAISVQSM